MTRHRLYLAKTLATELRQYPADLFNEVLDRLWLPALELVCAWPAEYRHRAYADAVAAASSDVRKLTATERGAVVFGTAKARLTIDDWRDTALRSRFDGLLTNVRRLDQFSEAGIAVTPEATVDIADGLPLPEFILRLSGWWYPLTTVPGTLQIDDADYASVAPAQESGPLTVSEQVRQRAARFGGNRRGLRDEAVEKLIVPLLPIVASWDGERRSDFYRKALEVVKTNGPIQLLRSVNLPAAIADREIAEALEQAWDGLHRFVRNLGPDWDVRSPDAAMAIRAVADSAFSLVLQHATHVEGLFRARHPKAVEGSDGYLEYNGGKSPCSVRSLLRRTANTKEVAHGCESATL